eukprot:CAMPEP_0167791112 /NCGR_PEP_ID=MMETSP0111_2-20121227/11728_1 /TAXON_ID=91324 /ORGANISM="Lotharella globosa, Strain CCCM811" /LENGTH=108 /DNA_ID=CAMNT_0007683691 /DNA_START=143 /DNA_END=469 /DNA_ORIENTATION=+
MAIISTVFAYTAGIIEGCTFQTSYYGSEEENERRPKDVEMTEERKRDHVKHNHGARRRYRDDQRAYPHQQQQQRRYDSRGHQQYPDQRAPQYYDQRAAQYYDERQHRR